MAKGKFITEYERQVIRDGFNGGCTGTDIAAFISRGNSVIYNHIKAMQKDGTIGNVSLFAEQVAEAIKNHAEARRNGQ